MEAQYQSMVGATAVAPEECQAWSGPNGSHTTAFLGHLLERLRRLPVVSPLTTHMFIPKGLVQRYSSFVTSVLTWWISEIEDGSALHEPIRAQCATLFLKNLDFLIARDIRPCSDSSGLEPNQAIDSAQISKTVRSRVQVLEQGRWLEAVDHALADAEAARVRAASRRTETQIEDDESRQTRKFEDAVHKVLHGDTRTGRRVLQSSGLLPASVETTRLFQSKFCD